LIQTPAVFGAAVLSSLAWSRQCAFALLATITMVCPAAAQQPFFNDDTDVADYHKWHFETNNEYDVLPFSSRPSVHQDTQTIKFSFGAFKIRIGYWLLNIEDPIVSTTTMSGDRTHSPPVPLSLESTCYGVYVL